MAEAKSGRLEMRILPAMRDVLTQVAAKEGLSVSRLAESFLALSLTTLSQMREAEAEVYMRSARLAMIDFHGIQAKYEMEQALQEAFFAELEALQKSTGTSSTSEEIVKKMAEKEGFQELKEWLMRGPATARDLSPLSVIVRNELQKLDAE